MGRLLSTSLISLPHLACAGDNATTIETKGSYTTVLVKQIGYSNVATVYCGLSGGTYTTHTCTRAAINISSTGYGNTAKAFSQWSNHSDNVFTVTQNGNNNYGYADLDDDENQGIVIQTGDSNHGEILMAGDNNVYKITQTGDSKYAKMYAFGDNADSTVVQSGTGQQNAYIYNANAADNNSSTVTQSGSGNHDADIFWYSDADDGTAVITQSGSGNHTARLKFWTDDYNVQVTQGGASNKSFVATYNCVSNCTKSVTITQYD
jgi:hypothetical protein